MPNIDKGIHGQTGLTASTSGVTVNSGILFTDRRQFYLGNEPVKELWTDPAPFLTLVANMNQKTDLTDPIFKMFEHRNPWQDQRFLIDGSETSALDPASNSQVTITLPTASTSNFIGLGTAATAALVGLQFAVHTADGSKPAGERKAIGVVTAFTSATEIGVKCISTYNGSAYTLTGTEWFVVIGNAHGEGSSSPEPWADDLSLVYGQCQIFRTPLRVTNTLKNAVLRGDADELIRLRKQKSQEHKIQKERAMIFGGSLLGNGMDGTAFPGDKFRTDANGEPIRTTTGIMEMIMKYGSSDATNDNQNIFSIAQATYKYSQFVDDMEKVFQYYPEDGVKTMFASAKMLSFWSKLEGTTGIAGKSGWQVKLSDMKRDTLGFNYRILETPHGIIQLVPTPVLTRSPYNGYGIIVDKSNIFHAVYEPHQYFQNIVQDNNPLYQKDEYYSYEGIGATLIESHKLFKIV